MSYFLKINALCYLAMVNIIFYGALRHLKTKNQLRFPLFTQFMHLPVDSDSLLAWNKNEIEEYIIDKDGKRIIDFYNADNKLINNKHILFYLSPNNDVRILFKHILGNKESIFDIIKPLKEFKALVDKKSKNNKEACNAIDKIINDLNKLKKITKYPFIKLYPYNNTIIYDVLNAKDYEQITYEFSKIKNALYDICMK